MALKEFRTTTRFEIIVPEDVKEIVNTMIEYGKFLASQNIGRGNVTDILSQCKGKIGPFWASVDNLPTIEELKRGGVVCIGLLSLCLCKVNLRPPFLDYLDLDGLDFGYGGTDEWLFSFRYDVKDFDPKGKYPIGTLLFRIYNQIDQGHVAILIEDSNKKNLLECCVLQSAGSPLGNDEISYTSTVNEQHSYYSKGQHNQWDKAGKFDLKFPDIGYYTHILTPDIYIPCCHKTIRKNLDYVS